MVCAVLLSAIAILYLSNEYAIASSSRRTKDIPYVAATVSGFDSVRHLLDVYQPRRVQEKPRPVVLFIHGGAWNSGSKNLYAIVGRRLAKQGALL